MRLKKKKEYKTERVSYRLTKTQLNILTAKAMLYTDGNLSEYLLYSALNFKPEISDLEDGGKTAENGGAEAPPKS